MDLIEQPGPESFCDYCGHFAARHDQQGCTGLTKACPCTGMSWLGHRWPRPWLPAPDGLEVGDAQQPDRT